MGATKTSCMIAFILAGAAFLTVAMGFTGIPRRLAEWIATLQLSPSMLIVALTLFFVVLGCFLDGISIVVLTTSVILPMVERAGIDRIWFGIYIVLVVEMAQITPPVGFNLFVLQGLTGDNILNVARAAVPFFLILVLAVVLIVLFPGIATWLPQRMNS
jgi:TRAP-type C4-dicarboxylate transport system permease large subunit